MRGTNMIGRVPNMCKFVGKRDLKKFKGIFSIPYRDKSSIK